LKIVDGGLPIAIPAMFRNAAAPPNLVIERRSARSTSSCVPDSSPGFLASRLLIAILVDRPSARESFRSFAGDGSYLRLRRILNIKQGTARSTHQKKMPAPNAFGAGI
jgi:hypothetical protein